MNRNVFASFSLSLAVWLLATVALRVEDRPGSRVPKGKATVSTARAATESARPPAATKPAVASSRDVRPRSIAVETRPSRTVQVSRKAGSEARVRPRSRPEVRSGFITTRPGETLRDVSRRAFGSEDSLDELWRANRDQTDGPDAILKEGTLLRTP